MIAPSKCSQRPSTFGASLLLAMLTLAGSACAAPQFPFNGSFEIVSGGVPVGWVTKGSWLLRPDAAATGRNGLTLRPELSREGMELMSNGYLLAEPGKNVTLSLSYTSETGGPSIVIIYCDALGRPMAEHVLEALPAAHTRTRYEQEIALGEVEIEVPVPLQPAATEETVADTPAADTPAAPEEAPVVEMMKALLDYRSIRIGLRMETNGVQARLDDVVIKHAGNTTPVPLTPKILAESRPNLLANPSLRLTADGALAGWAPVELGAYDAEAATLGCAGGATTATLLMNGTPRPTAWLSDPVVLDGALPYQVSVDLNTDALVAGQVLVALRLVDPQDAGMVWLQQEQLVEAGQTGPVTIKLPRLYNDRAPLRAQIAVALLEKAEGVAEIRSARLQPEPVSVSVRGVAIAGGFKRPQDVQIFVTAVNNTYAALKPKATMKVYDHAGNMVTQETRAIVGGARSAAYFPYKPKLTCPGEYTLKVWVHNSGTEMGTAEYGFSVKEG